MVAPPAPVLPLPPPATTDDEEEEDEEEEDVALEQPVPAGMAVADDVVLTAAAAVVLVEPLAPPLAVATVAPPPAGLTVLSCSWMSIMWSPRRMLRFSGVLPLRKSLTCESLSDSSACITVFSGR